MKCDSHTENITRTRSGKVLAPEWDKRVLYVRVGQTAGLINCGIY